MVTKLLGGRYEMRGTLGRGTRTDVYLAYDLRLDRDVAVKLLAATATPGEIERFRYDMLALAAIESDYLAPIYDLVVADAVAFAVLRHLEGEPLDAVLAAERAHEPVRAAHYVYDVLRAIQYVRQHRSGCDLNPSHVMLAQHRAFVLGITAKMTDELVDVERCGRLFLQLVLGRIDASADELDALTFPAAFALIISAAIAPIERRYPSVNAMAAALGLALRQMD